MDVKVGDKVKFEEERQAYTVQARNERFIICTKPFNVRKTTLYTIIDLERGVRGRDNLIFGMGYETPEQIQDNMERLARGDMEVSYRNFIDLRVERITRNA